LVAPLDSFSWVFNGYCGHILAMAEENGCFYFCFNHLCLLHNMFVAQIAWFHYFWLEMLITLSLLLFNFYSLVIIEYSNGFGRKFGTFEFNRQQMFSRHKWMKSIHQFKRCMAHGHFECSLVGIKTICNCSS
jgi:hypothetical protein